MDYILLSNDIGLIYEDMKSDQSKACWKSPFQPSHCGYAFPLQRL